MSLRDLKEEIYLVLQIKGGHAFGFATAPLVVTANLAGNIHESFITEPSPQPKFENEFVWVMDKTKMKSIWSDKIPVRVECFTVEQSRRNRIGYIILNVKDAQIVQDQSKIAEKQIRLLGLSKNVSLSKPELILSFYITDVPIQNSQLIPQFSPPLVDGQARMSDGVLKATLGSGRDHFSFVISPDAITNLKELLPSHSDLSQDLVTYSYSLLGAELVSDVASSHCLRLSLTSSLPCIKTYFIHQPVIRVRLYVGTLLVGETNINVENLLLSEEHIRKTKQQTRTMTCRCAITPAHHVTEISADTIPSVDFTITFSCESHLAKKKSEVSCKPASHSVGAGGDADSIQNILPQKPLPIHPLTTQSHVSLRSDAGGETYRTSQSATTHTIRLTVTAIHLETPLPQPFWLRLSRPGSQVSPEHQVPVPVSWTPLSWQLTVTLPQRLLESTLIMQPATLELSTVDRLVAVALPCPPHNLTSNPKHNECRTALEKDGEKVGEIVVTWSLADLSSQSASTLTDTSLSPPSHSKNAGPEILSPRARELKILSFVEELEDWAEKQRILVMEGLKEEEAARLASLQHQWESEVGGQVTEGRQLIGALHQMRDQLRKQEADMRENELKMKVYKEELERVHHNKLQEFKDLSRRMQDEFNHKLALIASDKVALEQEVEKLRDENVEVKTKLREAESKCDECRKEFDSLAQELKMLKEKLVMEQESKKFFKEHCRKAEQEIHRLNCLRQQELEARLHSEKKSLEQLAFQQIIVERNDLRQDQRLLEEIRQQLIYRPDINSNSNDGTSCTAGYSLADDRHIRRAT